MPPVRTAPDVRCTRARSSPRRWALPAPSPPPRWWPTAPPEARLRHARPACSQVCRQNCRHLLQPGRLKQECMRVVQMVICNVFCLVYSRLCQRDKTSVYRRRICERLTETQDKCPNHQQQKKSPADSGAVWWWLTAPAEARLRRARATCSQVCRQQSRFLLQPTWLRRDRRECRHL